MSAIDIAASYAEALVEEIRELPLAAIEQLVQELERVRDTGAALYTMGNGGSSSTASHVVNDLVKGAPGAKGERIRAYCLADNIALLTAYANDEAYEQCYAKQLEAFAMPGDLVLAVSGSGNSPNILRGLEVAKAKGCITAALLAYGGGKAEALADIAIVSHTRNMQRAEDLHVVVCHMVMTALVGWRG